MSPERTLRDRATGSVCGSCLNRMASPDLPSRDWINFRTDYEEDNHYNRLFRSIQYSTSLITLRSSIGRRTMDAFSGRTP